MNIFSEGVKNQISSFCICPVGSKKFCRLVREKIEVKFLAYFFENTY
jgi:hypothetical protein